MIRKRKLKDGSFMYDVYVTTCVGRDWNCKRTHHVRSFMDVEEARWCNNWIQQSVRWDKQIEKEREIGTDRRTTDEVPSHRAS